MSPKVAKLRPKQDKLCWCQRVISNSLHTLYGYVNNKVSWTGPRPNLNYLKTKRFFRHIVHWVVMPAETRGVKRRTECWLRSKLKYVASLPTFRGSVVRTSARTRPKVTRIRMIFFLKICWKWRSCISHSHITCKKGRSACSLFLAPLPPPPPPPVLAAHHGLEQPRM